MQTCDARAYDTDVSHDLAPVYVWMCLSTN
jgi:hypothetical protein